MGTEAVSDQDLLAPAQREEERVQEYLAHKKQPPPSTLQ